MILKGREGVCGMCRTPSTGVRPRHAQGAYVCGLCDDGRRDRRDYGSQFVADFWESIRPWAFGRRDRYGS